MYFLDSKAMKHLSSKILQYQKKETKFVQKHVALVMA